MQQPEEKETDLENIGKTIQSLINTKFSELYQLFEELKGYEGFSEQDYGKTVFQVNEKVKEVVKNVLSLFMDEFVVKLESLFHSWEPINEIFELIKTKITFLRKYSNLTEKEILSYVVDLLIRFRNHADQVNALFEESELQEIRQFKKYIINEFKDKEGTEELIKAVEILFRRIFDSARIRQEYSDKRIQEQKEKIEKEMDEKGCIYLGPRYGKMMPDGKIVDSWTEENN